MRFGVREVVDGRFLARYPHKFGNRTIKKGQTVYIFDKLTVSSMEVASTQTNITGGQQNNVLMQLDGDKTLTFTFTDALASNETFAILTGGDLVYARNPNLHGASPDAETVKALYTERFSVSQPNIIDVDADNHFNADPSLGGTTNQFRPRGGYWNVWLSKRPYVGQDASITVTLLDNNDEPCGDEVDISVLPGAGGSYFGEDDFGPSPSGTIQTPSTISWSLVLSVFGDGDGFVAFDKQGLPISLAKYPDPVPSTIVTNPYYGMSQREANAFFDDHVDHYVYNPTNSSDYRALTTTNGNWASAWGIIGSYLRTISTTGISGSWDATGYKYLTKPSGGIGQPAGEKHGSQIVYPVNVPTILYQDNVRLDYYYEYKHNAARIDITPDGFAGQYYFEGTTLWNRELDGVAIPARIVIPKLKIATAFTLSMSPTGDAATFDFTGTAFPDYPKFNKSKKVLAQIFSLDMDDNYDAEEGLGNVISDYRRYKYNEDSDGAYIWKDATEEAHSNLDWSDIPGPGGDFTLDGAPPFAIGPVTGTIATGAGARQFLQIPNEEFEIQSDINYIAP